MAKRWWVALITFERGEGEQDMLKAHQQGASGWMAGFADKKDELRNVFATSLSADGLRLLEIERETPIDTVDDVLEFDQHLAESFADRDPSKATIWGTIHCYLADGEA